MRPEKEFVKRLEGIRDACIAASDTKEETADKIIWTILKTIDGNTGINNFHRLGIIDYKEGKLVNGGNLLDIYRSEANE